MKKQKYLESELLSVILFLFLFLLYAVVYMTKNMFSSAMATIVQEGVMTKSQTGLINAVFWLVYALFQIVGGFAVDKYSPHKLVMLGLVGTIIANIIIYFNQSYPVIIAAWTFNAVVQFGLWPGVFKIISTQTAPAVRGKAVFWIMLSSSVGSGLSLLIASFVNYWQMNFLVSTISIAIMLALYMVLHAFLDKRMVTTEAEENPDNENSNIEKKPIMPLLFSSGCIVLMVVFFFRCAIDNGIRMMTPVILMESYEQLPAAMSTRMGSVLVIFSVIGMFVSKYMYRKITKDEVKAQIILYSLCVVPLVVVCFVGRIHYIFLLAALAVSVMLLSSAIPFAQSYTVLHFRPYGRIGTVSGTMNAVGSFGNILASYLFAKMAEMMSWDKVAISWALAIVLCAVLCIAVLSRWTRFTQRDHSKV